MLELVRGALKYDRKRSAMIPDPLKRAATNKRYTKARLRVMRFERLVRPCLDALPGIRAMERNHLENLCRKVYGLSRRYDGDLLLAEVIRAGGAWMRRGCDGNRVLAAVARALELRGVVLSKDERQKLLSEMVVVREGGVMPDTEKQLVIDSEGPMTGGDNGGNGKRPSRVAQRGEEYVRMTRRELRQGIKAYFHRTVEDENLAAEAAGELMTSLGAGEAKDECRMPNAESRKAEAAKRAKAEDRSGGEFYHKDSLCQTEFDVSLIRWRMI